MLSAKVPYYILDLLQQVPAVHVQGLGRFEAIFHPAVIDLPEARIKPPYVEPDFRYDQESPSEILSKYIAYAAGTTSGIAQGAIAAFVRKAYEHTENGMMFPIEKFGTFSRSASDQIRFTPDWDAFNLSFSGLEVLDLTPVWDSSNGYQNYSPPPSPPVQMWTEPEIKESVALVEMQVETIKPETQQSSTSISTQTTSTHQEQIDETTSRLWWIILTSAIVLIAILCAYLAWDIISNRNRLDELKRIYPDTTTIATQADTLTGRDTMQTLEDDLPIADGVNAQPEKTPPPPSLSKESGTPCYVVVGAFSDPANVTKMADRLVSLGYIVEQLKGGSLIRVAIRADCDAEQLQKVLNEARSSINPEAWIY